MNIVKCLWDHSLRSIQAICPQLHYLLTIMSYHFGPSPQVCPSTSFHISVILLPTCETWAFLMEPTITFISFSLHYFSRSASSLVMPSRFPWAVQVAKPEVKSLVRCELLANILRSSGTAFLPWELQQETGGGNLNFSLFSWPVSAERKRLFHLFLANPKHFS